MQIQHKETLINSKVGAWVLGYHLDHVSGNFEILLALLILLSKEANMGETLKQINISEGLFLLIFLQLLKAFLQLLLSSRVVFFQHKLLAFLEFLEASDNLFESLVRIFLRLFISLVCNPVLLSLQVSVDLLLSVIR